MPVFTWALLASAPPLAMPMFTWALLVAVRAEPL